MACPPLSTQDGALFQQYLHRISDDFGLEDPLEVWQALSEMDSFVIKGGVPKSGRWFSWHESGHAQIREWHATRMVLEHYVGETVAESSQSEEEEEEEEQAFKQLRKGAGGLKLAYRCTTQYFWEDCMIILTCGGPAYDWYNTEVRDCKSPTDALQFAARMATSWAADSHLKALASLLSADGKTKFERIANWSVDEAKMSKKIVRYTLLLLSHRCSSLSKAGSPPGAYASVLTSRPAPALQQVKRDLRYLVSLETAEGVPHSSNLTQDLLLSYDPPTRLLAQGFEAANWQVNASGLTSMEILKSMLATFADSKLIEDTHGRVRMVQQSQSNEKLTTAAIQQVVNDSGTLEARSLPHPAAVTKDEFLQHWHNTKDTFRAKERGNPRTHRLPRFFGNIMKRDRSWAAVTEPSLVRSAAGWEWIRFYNAHRLWEQQVQVQAGV